MAKIKNFFKKLFHLEQRTKGERILFVVMFVVFLLYAGSLLFAFGWGITSSFKSPREFTRQPPLKLPAVWLFSNYVETFKTINLDGVGYVSMLLNSIWYTFGGVIIYIVTQGLVCYILAKYDFKICSIMTSIGIVLMMLPIYGTLPATYKLYQDIKIFDTPFILIDCISLFGPNWLIMLSYYRNISSEYRDAAFIDGCGHFGAYLRIMVPLAAPILLSCGLLQFMGRWKDYSTPILFLESYPTLASGLFTFSKYAERDGTYPTYFAGMIVSCLPLLVLFGVFSKTMMENMAFGGLKG